MTLDLMLLLAVFVASIMNYLYARKNGSHIESVLKQEIYRVMDSYVDKIRKQAERAVDKGRTDINPSDDSQEAQFNQWLKEQNVL